MRLIYWSHSYRPEDEQVNRFFTRLFDQKGLRVSFDPPSESVNAAKLQRHLNGSDAMIAVLTRREGGPSPYILFEIELCVRSRKPLLVFVEDELPDDLIPGRVLQRRFSRRSYFRQVREHAHAIEILKTYLGDEPPPRYQPAVTQRSCVIAGDEALRNGDAHDGLVAMLRARGFRVITTSSLDENELETVEAIAQSQAALAFIDAFLLVSHFARGLLHGASVPMVEFTGKQDFRYRELVPRDLQPVTLPALDSWATMEPLIKSHMGLLEENFIEGAGPELDVYLDELLDVGAREGHYRESDRERVVTNIMGDQYTVGQAGAVGPGSRAERMTFVQTWNQMPAGVDATRLADELAKLREQLRAEATQPEHDAAIGAIAEAEMAAKDGNGPEALERLSLLKRLGGTGKWALGVATTIGTTVAAAALKGVLGV